MVRPEKVAVVEEIAAKLESSQAVFLTEYRGLSVAQQQELRRALRATDAEYKVLKMTLARRAAESAGFVDLVQWLEGPTAIAFTEGDPVPTAKGLKEFSDGNEALVIKGGLLGGAILEADEVRKLASLEPREVLLAMVAGALKAPLSTLAGLMSAVLRQPATVFQQLLEKKEAEPSGPTPGSAAEPADEPGAEQPTEAATDASDEEPGEEVAAAGEEPGEDGEASAEPVAEHPSDGAAEETSPEDQAAADDVDSSDDVAKDSDEDN